MQLFRTSLPQDAIESISHESISPRAKRWMQTALLVWGILAVALCIKIWAEGNNHSVYGAFVRGPRAWWANAEMYDSRGYYYSPTFAVLFTPFAALPDRIGQTLWGLLSVGLLLWSLRVFYRVVIPPHWPREAEAGFLLLTLAGSLRGIWSLQSNALILACILFAATALVQMRFWRASWWLAGPIYVKLWPLVAAGLLGIQWPKKMIWRLTLATIALGMLPFLTKAPSDVVGYYKSWLVRLSNRQVEADRFTGYRDAWTIWEQFTPVNKQAYFVLEAVGGLAVFAWCIGLRLRRANGEARPAAEIVMYTLAAWTCWQLLFGPGTERLTYLIAAPFAAWAVITSYIERRNFGLAIAAFVTLYLLGAGLAERLLVRVSPATVALQPVGLLLLAGWLVRHAASGNPWSVLSASANNAGPIAEPNAWVNRLQAIQVYSGKISAAELAAGKLSPALKSIIPEIALDAQVPLAVGDFPPPDSPHSPQPADSNSLRSDRR